MAELRLGEIMALKTVVYQSATETEDADAAVQLGDRGCRILHRQDGEGREARRVLSDDAGQVIVGEPRVVCSDASRDVACSPGTVSDSTCMSMPVAPISGNRNSVKSASLRLQASSYSGLNRPRSGSAGYRASSSGIEKDSSRAMYLIADFISCALGQ